MANPAPTINQINAFNATQGTTIDFNIIGGTELVRSNRIYIYDLSDNSLICTHLYASTESIHELPPNTDGSIVYESGKSSADFVNGAQYYAQIQTFTDIGGTEGGSGLSVAKMFWCLNNPTLTINTIPSTISTTSYNVSATYDANTSVVSNIIQQYQFSLYSATGSLLQSSGVVVGSGTQQGTSTAYDISYNFTGLSVGSSYYVTVEVTTTQGMSVSVQSSTFTVSIDTPTLGEATVVNNACDGYISVTSNLSSEYGGSASGDIVSFETDSENVFTKLQVDLEPVQDLNGYDAPWVGGAGVNLYNASVQTISNTTSISGETFTMSWTNGAVQITGKNKQTFPAGTYTIKFTGDSELSKVNVGVYFASTEAAFNNYYGMNTAKTFTISDEFYIGIYGQYDNPSTSTFKVQLEKGSTATEWSPYENICPISGHDEVGVSVCGVNVWDEEWELGNIYSSTGQNGDSTTAIRSTNYIPIKPNTQYYVKIPTVIGLRWYAKDKSYIEPQGVSTSGVVTTPNNAYYLRFVIGLTTYNNDISINYPSTDHDYHAYDGQTVSQEFDVSLTPTSKDTDPYLFKAVGDIYGDRLDEELVGGSVVWNQLCNATSVTITSGHKYYMKKGGTETVGASDGTALTGLTVGTDIVRDLTQMLGSTIADYINSLGSTDGVAFLKRYFITIGIYDSYDTGTLKSVNPTAHVTRGVNAWDEEWEVGGLSTVTGEPEGNINAIRSKNFVPCVPSMDYWLTTQNPASYLWFYDANKNFMSFSTNVANRIFTTPSGCHYMKLRVGDASHRQTTYNNDICINISNPTINGKYFPYEEHTYDLGNVELRGIPKLVNGKLTYDGDIRKYDGTVTRKYVHVPKGSNFILVNTSPSGYKTYSYNTSNARAAGDTYPLTNIGLKGVLTFSSATVAEECIQRTSASNASIYFAISSSRDIEDIELVYELATPTTEQTDPFEQIQEVSKYGTLEYITTNDVPVGHNTTYLTRDIFGGTLDLVSGRLVVDRAMATFDGSESGWAWVGGRPIFRITDMAEGNNMNGLSNWLPTVTDFSMFGIRFGYGNNIIYLCELTTNIPSITDLASFKTYIGTHNLSVVYPLATPLTYQLTPQQIQTLVGTNNVWSEQGDIELSYHIPITNLLVKRQDVDDVSGNWLTLYSQPVEQASDMDFTFIDFLNQYGKTYKYALVPLLTQTQSGVEVEVEGGYTVSDEVQSIFDGVFISDSTGSQKCKANVGYGNVNMNQSVGSITPIGSQYPIIVTNSNNRYHNGSISGMIVPDDYYYNGNLSRIDMVNKRNELEQFLTNKRAKIIKDWNSNIWLVMIMDNIDCSFDNNYGMGIVTFNANWLEVGDPTNQEDLQATGLVDVGGV